MSIPLDYLYHYIESVAGEMHGDSVLIYHFYPHGSKKIENLSILKELPKKEDWVKRQLSPELFCNDQEPLNYQLYDKAVRNQYLTSPVLQDICKKHSIEFPSYNLRGIIENIWDHALLLHSEKKSKDVELYCASQFIPVYYWSHGIIALDWFRFARHLEQKKQSKKLFLIYNRAWSGTREYRLRFADLIAKSSLTESCLTTVSYTDSDSGAHYSDYNFLNLTWKPDIKIEDHFVNNSTSSCFSADFKILDYE